MSFVFTYDNLLYSYTLILLYKKLLVEKKKEVEMIGIEVVDPDQKYQTSKIQKK